MASAFLFFFMPTLINCTISGNRATNNGGGMNNFSSSNPTLKNCLIWNNRIGITTGSADANLRNSSSTAEITFSLIRTVGDNSDNCHHVVIAIGSATTTELNGFTISGGNANVSSSSTNPVIERSLGGGIFIGSASHPTISNCIFTANIAGGTVGGAGGAAMSVYPSSNPTISNCTFSGNATTSNSSASGGAFISALPTL